MSTEEEGQQAPTQESNEHQTEAGKSYSILGPYEVLTTKILDELLKVLPVLGMWLIALGFFIAPKSDKDFIQGIKEDFKAIDGNLAKLAWSFGAPIAATKFRLQRLFRTNNSEQEQEL